ncbi:MAG: ExbD/TolR family protein [bacterium]
MNRTRRRSRRSPENDDEAIDIIPLIDVMFLLLCFFIFLTLAMVMQEGIAVELAQAQSGESVTSQKEPLAVSVKADGSIYLNKEEVKENRLKQMLQAHASENPDRPVRLNAAKGAKHSHVIKALDAIRQSKLSNLVFTIKPEQ